MHIEYDDITSRISEFPKWWLNGVPRYCDFSPHEVGVYEEEAALILIEGQCPNGKFEIGLGSSAEFPFGLRSALAAHGGWLDVGDPPNVEKRASPHMLASAIEVLQFWHRIRGTWVRDSQYERRLVDERELPLPRVPYLNLLFENWPDEIDSVVLNKDDKRLAHMLTDLHCFDPGAAVMEVMSAAQRHLDRRK